MEHSRYLRRHRHALREEAPGLRLLILVLRQGRRQFPTCVGSIMNDIRNTV